MNANQVDIFDYLLMGQEKKAKDMMRKLIKENMGFEEMSKLTGIPSKSIHRMLSYHGNPTTHNLFLIARNL